MVQANRSFIFTVLLVLMFLHSGCTYFRSVVLYPTAQHHEALRQIQSHWLHGDILIIHNEHSAYRMVELRADSLSGKLVFQPVHVDERVIAFSQPYRRHGRIRRAHGEQFMLDQVHVFVRDSFPLHIGKSATLMQGSIIRVEQIKADRLRNAILTTSIVLGVTAATATALVLIAISQMTIDLGLRP
jgi:hypothetical protein